MFSFEIVVAEFDENGDLYSGSIEYAVINGIPDEEGWYSTIGEPSLYIRNKEVLDIVINQSYQDVKKFFASFTHSKDVDWWEESLKIEVICDKYFKNRFPSISVTLELQQWEHWAKPWSMAGFAQEFKNCILEFGNENYVYFLEDESILSGFGITYIGNDENIIIDNELNRVLEDLSNLVELVHKNLMESIDNEVVLTYFQLPLEYKTACKQYLLYFGQFILDLGISVETEIEEIAGETLFKVIPNNKAEGLENIRDALNIYLNAPNQENFKAQITNYQDTSIQQWEANIFHLKSQIALSNSILQAKDATIEALQLSNQHYKTLPIKTKEILAPEEDLIKGIVKVGQFKWNGITIELSELLRKLKRKLH